MSCVGIIEALAKTPPLDGHLSVEHGFMPSRLPLHDLTGEYKIWDQYVDQIPELYFSNKSQETLSAMPLISTSNLKDCELNRAALVLSLLAHAYWRHGVDRAFALRMNSANSFLPENILTPWKEINCRLGRGSQPYQGFYDLFINNFYLLDSDNSSVKYSNDEVVIENIDVLVKSFGNQAERVFYMSFVEMHAVASPLVGMVCALEETIKENAQDAPYKIIDFLFKVDEILKKCLNTLKKISPVSKHKTYCDPILWSKTVAIFAVAPSDAVQGGTSGAFAPLALTLDALFNRNNYNSKYGQYVINEKANLLPDHILEFVKHVGHIRLADYITAQVNINPNAFQKLVDAYNKVIDTYAGAEGFLSKHTSKVFNYLGVSTMVGRNQSTSGHERFVHKQSWVEVCADLKISRLERRQQTLIYNEVVTGIPQQTGTENLPVINVLELARHHKADDCWVSINGFVYDITDFLAKHPGGDTIMITYAGRDVSEQFNTIVAHKKPALIKLMSRYLIGKFNCETCTEDNYILWHDFLDKLLFVRTVIAVQYHHLVNKKLEILYAGHTHTHFIHEHISEIVNTIPCKNNSWELQGKEWEILSNTEFVTTQDLRGEFSESQNVHFAYVSQLFEKEDLSVVDDLIEFILDKFNSGQKLNEQVSLTCISIIQRWLKNHLKLMHIIENQEMSLFGHSLLERVQNIDTENPGPI